MRGDTLTVVIGWEKGIKELLFFATKGKKRFVFKIWTEKEYWQFRFERGLLFSGKRE